MNSLGPRNSKRSMPRSPSPDPKHPRMPAISSRPGDDLPAMGFDMLTLRDFLETDPRPTFAIDLAGLMNNDMDLSRIVYANSPMRASRCHQALVNLQKNITASGHNTADFWAWAIDHNDWQYGVDFASYTFAGMRWNRITRMSRWRVICGCDSLTFKADGAQDISQTRHTPGKPQVLSASLSVSASSPISEVYDRSGFEAKLTETSTISDWTSSVEPHNLTPHIRFARSLDWSKTSMGPMNTWTKEFRMSCNFLMTDPRPATLIWGPDRHTLWNEAYLDIVGERHPDKFGLPFHEVYPEIKGFYEYFTLLENTGQGLTKEDSEFHLTRNGFVEETYYSFTLLPIYENNRFMGIYNPVFETTRRQIAERRMTTLIKLGESIAANKDMKQYWQRVVRSMQLNEHDFPFASVYSVSISEEGSDTASVSSDLSRNSSLMFKKLSLEGSIGIPEGHPAAKDDIDLANGQDGFEPHFREAARSGEVIALHTVDGTLPESLLQDIRCRPLGDLCRSIVLLPIKPTGGAENIGGFVLLGLNPRRPFDQDYYVFFNLLSQLLGTSMAATLLIEEEVRRSRTAAKRAALDQAKLQQELAQSAMQAKRLEMQFTHFADRAPIGINVFNSDGKILYANEIWYNLTMYDRTEDNPMGWIGDSLKAGTGDAHDVWRALLIDKTSVTFECRLKKPWRPPGLPAGEGEKDFTWILASAYPEVNPEDGSVEEIIGCFMDISQHKWAEELQTRRMNEAIEAKKLQENFIDMTSHEMRNPLSAIIHCCDGIISALSDKSDSPSESMQISEEAISNSLEAARTILHCSVHQKRIVDDILVLSKLESDLLPVAPVNVQIKKTVEEALSMFQAELKSADIELKYEVHESFTRLGIDTVYVDPSRLAQVFINLMTNAIKFTQTEPRRLIQVRIAATLQRPTTSTNGVKYVPSKNADFDDITSSSDWGDDEVVYLQFAVSDTGRGLAPSEFDLLFRRFSQASPRTHVQYGGSGLGLYIARELTEKQGGEIGVMSEAGKGSTFAFYVKSRRAPTMKSPPHPQRRSSVTKSHATMGLERTLSSATNDPDLRQSLSPQSKPKHQQRQQISPSAAARFPILIVEDNVVNRMVLKKQLSRLGFPIHEANHGEEALAFLQETKFWSGKEQSGKDLAMVLMDLEMPVMDGLTCMRKIRELQTEGTVTTHVPTIAVTANARKEQIETALAAGMDNVVCKPFRIPELVKQMEMLEMEQRAEEKGETPVEDGS